MAGKSSFLGLGTICRITMCRNPIAETQFAEREGQFTEFSANRPFEFAEFCRNNLPNWIVVINQRLKKTLFYSSCASSPGDRQKNSNQDRKQKELRNQIMQPESSMDREHFNSETQ